MKTSLPLHHFTLRHTLQALVLAGSLPLWSAAAHAADATDKNRPLRLENPEERAMLAGRLSEAIAKVKSEHTPPKPRRGKKPAPIPPIPVVAVEVPPAKPAPKGKYRPPPAAVAAVVAPDPIEEIMAGTDRISTLAAEGVGTPTANGIGTGTATDDIETFSQKSATGTGTGTGATRGTATRDIEVFTPTATQDIPLFTKSTKSTKLDREPPVTKAARGAEARMQPDTGTATQDIEVFTPTATQDIPLFTKSTKSTKLDREPPVAKIARGTGLEHGYSASRASELAAYMPPSPESDPGQVRWSYQGAMGPQNWGRLHSSFSLCEQGLHQSPLHITAADTVTSPAEPLQPGAQPFGGVVVHNGRGIEVKVDGTNTLLLRGTLWQLVRVQFHHPAEERIHYQTIPPMSTDLLYQSMTGQLAVVSVPMQLGAENPFLAKIWPHLPTEYGDRAHLPAGQLQLHELLPPDVRYYQYLGSMTAPPCTEGVLRIVLKNPASVSPEQLQLLVRAAPPNARPPQPTEGRVVREGK